MTATPNLEKRVVCLSCNQMMETVLGCFSQLGQTWKCSNCEREVLIPHG